MYWKVVYSALKSSSMLPQTRTALRSREYNSDNFFIVQDLLRGWISSYYARRPCTENMQSTR